MLPVGSAVSIDSTQRLLSALRSVKNDFRVVEAAVTNHLRDGRERAVEAAGKARLGRTLRSIYHGGYAPAAAVIAFEELSGSGHGLDSVPLALTSLEMTPFKTTLYVGGASTMLATWYQATRRLKATAASADRRCDRFLVSGVAVELALGDLQEALADARRGLPGSDELLAIRATEAQEAVREYVTAMKTLGEADLTVRFPWATRDVDVAEARELIDVSADAVLAQVEIAGAVIETVDSRPGRPGVITSADPEGGLDAVTAAVTTLRTDLRSAGQGLDQIAETLRKAVRQAADEAGGRALEGLAGTVAEARLYVGFMEADCAGFEAAARSASASDHGQEVVAILGAVPSTANFRAAVREYAARVEDVESHLSSLVDDEALRGAHVAAWLTRHDTLALTTSVDALAAAIDAEPANFSRRVTA